MEDSITANWLEEIVKQCSWLDISGSDRVKQILDLDIEDAVPKGFNYAGRLLRLRSNVEYSSGKTKKLSLVLKLVPLSQDQIEFISEHRLFITETMIYDNVLSKMEKLLLDHGIKRELDWPKHFIIDKENALLLEDLKELRYTTLKQREATYEEGVEVMRTLGRFHAMTKILIDQGKIDINQYKVNNMVESDSVIDFVYLTTLKGIIDAVRSTQQKELYSTVDLIEKNINQFNPELKALMKLNLDENTTASYYVLNHGDCWPNNIMFQHSTTNNQPTGVKLIDFQLCFYSSFAWDLVHFMYCAYLSETREHIKTNLVLEYRKTLVEYLRHLGKETSSVPSVEEIIMHMENRILFGLLAALATIPRLIPGLKLDFDFDITLPEHTHKAKTAIFSKPEVSRLIKHDLQKLSDIIKKWRSVEK